MPNKVVDYVSIVKSKEYQQRLVEMANSIKNSSKIAPNEATIESRFDCELFAFLVIEFKQPSTLSNKRIKDKAINQISDYLKGIHTEDDDILEGYVTNGIEGCFVTCYKGEPVAQFVGG